MSKDFLVISTGTPADHGSWTRHDTFEDALITAEGVNGDVYVRTNRGGVITITDDDRVVRPIMKRKLFVADQNAKRTQIQTVEEFWIENDALTMGQILDLLDDIGSGSTSTLIDGYVIKQAT